MANTVNINGEYVHTAGVPATWEQISTKKLSIRTDVSYERALNMPVRTTDTFAYIYFTEAGHIVFNGRDYSNSDLVMGGDFTGSITDLINLRKLIEQNRDSIAVHNIKIGELSEKLTSLEVTVLSRLDNIQTIKIPAIENDIIELRQKDQDIIDYIEQLKGIINVLQTTVQTDLQNYFTKTEINDLLNQIRSSIDNLDIPSIEGLASEKYVDDAVAAVDHSGYALKSEIPSIEGLASEKYVDDAISNIRLDIKQLPEFKTVNGESIIKTDDDDNIEIEAGSGVYMSDVPDETMNSAGVGEIGESTVSAGELKGKNISDILTEILFKETWTDPGYSHSINLASITSPVFSCDVDNTVITNPSYSAKWNSNIQGEDKTITTNLTATVTNRVSGSSSAVDISSGKYFLTGFSTLEYVLTYSYGAGYYTYDSSYKRNPRRTDVPAVSGNTIRRTVESTYPCYIKDLNTGTESRQSVKITYGTTGNITADIGGRPEVWIPGGKSTAVIQVDLGLGYMDVSWSKDIRQRHGINYTVYTKPDAYSVSSSHKLKITVKD